MITGSAAPSLPSFLPFYLRLRALSIQRAQLSRSLEQATSTRTTNSVRSILGSQYSIGNPTLSHVQLFENHIKRARLLFFLKQVLGSNMIPLRTKFDTQTTVISQRRRKRVSSSAGLLFSLFGVSSAIADTTRVLAIRASCF